MSEHLNTTDFSILVAGALCESGVDRNSLHIDRNGFTIRCTDGSGNVTRQMNLANFYAAYVSSKSPEDKKQQIERIVKSWNSCSTKTSLKNLSAPSTKLPRPSRLPRIKFLNQEGTFKEEVQIQDNQTPVIMPFAETISVVVDEVVYHLPDHLFAELCSGILVQIREYPKVYELTEPLDVSHLEQLCQ